MANIEKRHIINRHNLSGEFYFTSILQEAYSCGLLSDSDLENIQIQCVSLLAYKTERYNMGKSSSIRVETAESIMKSNFYSIGLYLKTLPDPDDAVFELKTVNISELYERGRKLINIKFKTARHIYNIVQKNRLDTPNHSYNSTLGEDGIGIFFKSYNIEYKAHDCSASIDYQLCNPVNDLAGVEFIQKYIENLYFENDFCKNFDNERIHHLLSGYDENYAELLINIFEQVLTAALGCSLADRSIRELSITEEDIWRLYEKLKKYDNDTLMMAINSAVNHIYEELNITNHSLKGYIEKSLPKIVTNIEIALKLNTLDKVFITPKNPDLEAKIHFETGIKMDDEEYRELIEELIECRYTSDKLKLIKDKVKSFDELEDVLLDAQLNEEEFNLLLNTLGDVELAAMIKRHPFESDIQAVDLSEEEQAVRLYLKNYMNRISNCRREKILQIAKHLV